jgi:MFS family permease
MADGGMARDKRSYTILALLSATYLVDSFFRAAPSALSNALITEFGLNYANAGLVMSIYTLPYALMQIPSGLLGQMGGEADDADIPHAVLPR